VASLLHFLHGPWVHPQPIAQHGGELVVARVSVQPDEAVAALAPRLEVAEIARAQLAAARRYERHLDHGLLVARHDGRCWHTASHLAAGGRHEESAYVTHPADRGCSRSAGHRQSVTAQPSWTAPGLAQA
jgi:hypothetical protein